MTEFAFRKSRFFATLAALIFTLGIYCTQAQAAPFMPTFTLPDAATGNTVESRSFKGKVILINFFTTW